VDKTGKIILFWKRDFKQGSFIGQFEPEGSCSPRYSYLLYFSCNSLPWYSR